VSWKRVRERYLDGRLLRRWVREIRWMWRLWVGLMVRVVYERTVLRTRERMLRRSSSHDFETLLREQLGEFAFVMQIARYGLSE